MRAAQIQQSCVVELRLRLLRAAAVVVPKEKMEKLEAPAAAVVALSEALAV